MEILSIKSKFYEYENVHTQIKITITFSLFRIVHNLNFTMNAEIHIPMFREPDFQTMVGISCHHSISPEYNLLHEIDLCNDEKIQNGEEDDIRMYIHTTIIRVTLIAMFLAVGIVIITIHRKKFNDYELPQLGEIELDKFASNHDRLVQ